MQQNHLSFDTIITRNKGKLAEYELLRQDSEYMFAVLYFKNEEDEDEIKEDQIAFYHSDYATDKIECLFFKKFLGKVKTIKLKVENCKEALGSRTTTTLLINDEVYSIWIVSSNGDGDESIKWELRGENQ
jgi:hypothetical protein